MVVNTSGGIDSYNDFYSFGLQMPSRNQTAYADGRLKFTGKERDAAETGWDYFGARYYDSWRGQWLQMDPLSPLHPDYTPYAYVYNNPINFIDPFGLDTATVQWPDNHFSFYDIGNCTVYGGRSSVSSSNTNISGGGGGNFQFGGNQVPTVSGGNMQVPEVTFDYKRDAAIELAFYRRTSSAIVNIMKDNDLNLESWIPNLKYVDINKFGNRMVLLEAAMNILRLWDNPQYKFSDFTFDQSALALAWKIGGIRGSATGILLSYGKGLYDYYSPLFEEMERRHEEVFGK